jgi:hypothetical protein
MPSSLLPSPATMDLLQVGGGSRGGKGGLSVSLPGEGHPFAGSIPSPGLMAMSDAAEVSNDATADLGMPCRHSWSATHVLRRLKCSLYA